MRKSYVIRFGISIILLLMVTLPSTISHEVKAATFHFLDDFSSYPTGTTPTGWSQYGTTAISPVIVTYGGSGADFQRLRFPAYTNQATNKWLIRDNLIETFFSATVKINFQSSSDGAGIIIAWKDPQNYIAILPNPFWDEIVVWEFVNGNIRSTFNRGGRYSVPIITNRDYWLRVDTTQTSTGEKQIEVYWSTDGVNFTWKDTATNIHNLTGQVGVGTYQFLSDVLFDDFTLSSGSDKYPVVLLPGIMGSKLTNSPNSSPACLFRPYGEIWIERLWNERVLFFHNISSLMLNIDGDGNPSPENNCDQILATGIMDNDPFNYYGQMVENLTQSGYQVFPFAYDWRLSLELNAAQLDQRINEIRLITGEDKVVLLGHSMGGLLAREYISSEIRAQKVIKVVSVGSPYWGAPKLAHAMRDGKTGIPSLDNITWLVGGALKNLIRNSPGAMELLPSRAFTDQSGPYYWVNDQELDYEQTLQHFVSKGQNSILLSKADLFHQRLDDFRSQNLNGVPYFVLITNTLATSSTIVEVPCWSLGTCYYVRRYTSGDGTVPWSSARLWGSQGDWKGNAQVCTMKNIDADHSLLMENSGVQNLIIKILNESMFTSSDCQEIQTFSASQTGIQSDDNIIPPFNEIIVKGNCSTTVTDEFTRIAQINNGLITNEIPHATYEWVNQFTTITLPSDNTYLLTIEPLDTTSCEIRVTDFRSDSDPGEFKPYQRGLFFDIPSSPGGVASLSLNYSQGIDSLQLNIDQDGDGTYDLILDPTSVLGQTESLDFTPPVTTITVTGNQDELGMFSGPVTISLQAEDNISGVFSSEISLDSGLTWELYSEPIQIVAEEIPVVFARSMDLAGNEEFPPAEVRLSPIKVFMPFITR